MNNLLRSLLGVTLLAGLLPVAAVALPRGLEDRMFWIGDKGTAEVHAGRAVMAVADPKRSAPPFGNPSGWERRDDRSRPTERAKRSWVVVDTLSSSTTTEAGTPTTTEAATPTTTAVSKSSTSTAPPSTTTTTTKPADGSEQSKGPITGDACPCTVTGTVELKGEISLQGDLTVKGGTLIARPGVNLDGNGFQIVFMEGGKADFQGTPVFTWSGNGSNANLERDINFRDLQRIIHHSEAGASIMRFFTVSDSGTPTIGDYPLHWHLNGNSSRGTIVEGVVVINGGHHAFVPHGSHGITFKDTIARNTSGDAYWWDPPGTNESCEFQKFCTKDNSNDITYDHALAYNVTKGPNDTRGFRLTGFALGAGAGNVIRNSVATNISPSHIKDCSGFHWPEWANGNTGGNVWEFTNNQSSSSSGCHGIFVWQNDSNPHIVDGFTGGGIDHGAYKNRYVYKNIDVPYLEVHAAGWRVASGRIDIVFTRGHRSALVPTAVFENVTINRFVIQNGNGELPGHYVLNNTGLGCDDIEYELVFPGTKVIIDGEECGS